MLFHKVHDLKVVEDFTETQAFELFTETEGAGFNFEVFLGRRVG